MAETESAEINCVYVDTNLDTHLLLPVDNNETVSDFKGERTHPLNNSRLCTHTPSNLMIVVGFGMHRETMQGASSLFPKNWRNQCLCG